MEFFKSAFNYISDAVSKVFGTNDSKKKTVPAKKTTGAKPAVPMVKENLHQNTDTVSIVQPQVQQKTQTVPTQKKPTLQQSVGATMLVIDNDCKKYNLDSKRLHRTMCELTGVKNMSEFYKLPQKEQFTIVMLVSNSLQKVKDIKEYSSEDIDVTEVVAENVKYLYELKDKEDSISGSQQIADIFAEIKANANSLTPKKIAEIRNRLNSAISSIVEAKKAGIASIADKTARIEAQKALKQEIETATLKIYAQLLYDVPNEYIFDFISIVSSNNIVKAEQSTFNTRKNARSRQRLASTMTYERQQNIIRDRYNAGDPMSTQTVRNFTTIHTANKSKEDNETFANDYFETRQSYGENGYPEYMNEEYMIATASGISAGIQVNEFMSTDERANMIADFYQKEDKLFGDLTAVKAGADEAVTNYIQENQTKRPELQREIEVIKNKVDKTISHTKEQNTKPSDTEVKPEQPSIQPKRYDNHIAQQTVINNHLQKNIPALQTEQQTICKNNIIVTPAKVQMELGSGKTVKEITGNYNVPEAVVFQLMSQNNNHVASHEEEFKNYIRNLKNPNAFRDLANCSKAREIIAHYNRLDNVDELFAILEEKSSFNERQILKREKEEHEVA